MMKILKPESECVVWAFKKKKKKKKTNPNQHVEQCALTQWSFSIGLAFILFNMQWSISNKFWLLYTCIQQWNPNRNQLFIFDIVHGYCFHLCLVALHIHCCLVLQGSAEGELYIDDFHTFSYKEAKQFVHRHLSFSANTLSSRSVCSFSL